MYSSKLAEHQPQTLNYLLYLILPGPEKEQLNRCMVLQTCLSFKNFRLGNYPSCKIVRGDLFVNFPPSPKNIIFC